MAIGTRVETIPAYIDGEWVMGDATTSVSNPYRGEPLAEVAALDAALVDRAVRSAAAARPLMAEMPAYARAALLERITAAVADRADALARAMVVQGGRALKDCRTEVERSIDTLGLSAEEAKRIEGEVVPVDAVASGAGKLGFWIRVPVGVVAAIYPFNAPLNLACHKLGPALAAGNTVVLKAPIEGALVSKLLVEAVLAAGTPPTAVQLVHGGGGGGAALVEHPLVDLINFTGGGDTALRIVRAAGLRRTLFELGGNGATIVHSDANIEKAAAGIVPGAFGMSGQSCVSVQRVYAHRDVFDEFLGMVVERTQALVIGDPLDPQTDIGSMVSEEAARRVESWIEEAVARGARVLTGGRRSGATVEPAILVDVKDDDKVVCQEVFGPTMSVIPYDTIEEAFAAANDTPWGLQAGIYTRSLDVAVKAARSMQVGGLNVNGPSRGRTDVQPYGGVKQSGWGREGPRYAIREMTDMRMVTFAPAD
jgi:acyl-CoA reductase-like NAD-dependent aldehyde dehydrogenase